MGVRAEQKDKRREDILMAGLDLFVRKGFAATKITDIAEQLNMSRGLLFHYFKSKEVLYEELIGLGLSVLERRTEHLVKEPLEYFRCAIDTILSQISDEMNTSPMYILMVMALKSEATPEKLKEKINAAYGKLMKLNVEKIKLGQAMGQIREGNAEVLALTIISCINGVIENRILNPAMPLPETEWILDIVKKH
jgi:AcrR family transcriptional regulator